MQGNRSTNELPIESSFVYFGQQVRLIAKKVQAGWIGSYSIEAAPFVAVEGTSPALTERVAYEDAGTAARDRIRADRGDGPATVQGRL